MQKDIEIKLAPSEVGEDEVLKKTLSAALEIEQTRIKGYKILKRSIDARGRNVVYRLQVRAFIDENFVPDVYRIEYANVKDRKPVLIVGAGPAGLFAAFWMYLAKNYPTNVM